MRKKTIHNLIFSSLLLLAVSCFFILGDITQKDNTVKKAESIEVIETESDRSITSDVRIVINVIESVKHIFHTIQ